MVGVEDDDDDFFVEPLLYDEAKLFAEMDAEREAHLRAEEEQARKDEERRRRGAAHRAVMDSILERDPKTGREVYTRYSFTDFSIFDIDEQYKSLILIAGFFKRIGRDPDYVSDAYMKENVFRKLSGYIRGLNLQDSANILSVKIASSDRGFPINVYGTIIARDSVDHKCIYIFNRHREDYQTINSEDESLILTGPGRGLVLLDFIYLEINLKIKVDGEPLGQQISKGLLSIDGLVQPRDEKVNFGSRTLESWFSTMKVSYATILNAVEGTFEIEILEGHFCGDIRVAIQGVEEKIVIHNSKEDGVVTFSGDLTVITLQRRVLTICLGRMLTFEFFISPTGRPAPDPLKTQISVPTSRPPTPADQDRVLRPYNSIDNSKLSRASKTFSPASARVAKKPGPAETGGMSSSRRSLSPLFDPELLASIERDLLEEGAHIKRVIGSDKPKQPKVVPAIVAEGRCPPGGADAVMLYTTTLRSICKTFEECNAVRAAIEAHDVKLIERDVSMDSGYKEELRLLLGARELRVPAVFVRGKHVGGAAEVTKMEEEGKLKALLQGLPRARIWCTGCAGVRSSCAGTATAAARCASTAIGRRRSRAPLATTPPHTVLHATSTRGGNVASPSNSSDQHRPAAADIGPPPAGLHRRPCPAGEGAAFLYLINLNISDDEQAPLALRFMCFSALLLLSD
ncbi:hypothetical protein ACQ4PT_033311 [Festuca glaucescens]